MSTKTCLQRRCGQQELLHLEAGQSKKDGEEEEEYLYRSSQCPVCHQERSDVLLILPCSHTICGICITKGEEVRLNQPHSVSSLPVCSVLCPCCRHQVELPCWSWSSATSCLPKYPTLRAVCVSRGTGSRERASREQVDTHSQEIFDEAKQSCCSDSSSTSLTEEGDVDLQEKEMEQSVYGLFFALDALTVPPLLHLSNSSLTATYEGNRIHGSHHSTLNRRSPTSDPWVNFPLVRADVVLRRGQYYWEVDVCNSTIYRIGVSSVNGSCGWWLERHGPSFRAVYDGSLELICTIPPQIKSIGIFLNIGGGVLSFHNPVTQEHLATLPTHFSPSGVYPALGLGQGRLKVRCGLPPPPHVFLSKNSTYRGAHGAGGGRWQREVPFKSVRKVIQKFEELAVSDSDSGLVSSFGSSCSTLASLPDPCP